MTNGNFCIYISVTLCSFTWWKCLCKKPVDWCSMYRLFLVSFILAFAVYCLYFYCGLFNFNFVYIISFSIFMFLAFMWFQPSVYIGFFLSLSRLLFRSLGIFMSMSKCLKAWIFDLRELVCWDFLRDSRLSNVLVSLPGRSVLVFQPWLLTGCLIYIPSLLETFISIFEAFCDGFSRYTFGLGNMTLFNIYSLVIVKSKHLFCLYTLSLLIFFFFFTIVKFHLQWYI